MPREYYFFIAALILVDLIGLRSSNRSVHAALPLLWLALIVGYESATSIHRIAAG